MLGAGEYHMNLDKQKITNFLKNFLEIVKRNAIRDILVSNKEKVIIVSRVPIVGIKTSAGK